MVEQKFPLAFGLSVEDVNRAEVIYRYQPGATGGDGQEIRISASKGIVLRREKGKDGKSESREAKIPPERLNVLLGLFESESFLAEPRELGEHREGPSRSIALNLPGKRHQITVFDDQIPEFELLAGAIKYIAGLGISEAIGQGFLPNL